MSLDETLIGLELILILFTGIVYMIYRDNQNETLRITTIILVILDLVGFIVLWATLIK